MLRASRLPGWTALFLTTTVLTSVTGFFFPAAQVLPSHIVGVISLVVLAVTILALYVKRLAGSWRWIYVIGAVLALYLNSLRRGRPGVPEGAGPEPTGADAVRAAVPCRAAGGRGALRRARHPGRPAVPPGGAAGEARGPGSRRQAAISGHLAREAIPGSDRSSTVCGSVTGCPAPRAPRTITRADRRPGCTAARRSPWPATGRCRAPAAAPCHRARRPRTPRPGR